MTLVMAYLPIHNLERAVTACANADCISMDNSVLYWEFVTRETAKMQNLYIVDELLNAIGAEDDKCRYHIIKWDKHHQAFLVLFSSTFMPNTASGVNLAPNWEFFKGHILGTLYRMSRYQYLVGKNNDGRYETVAKSYPDTVIYTADNGTSVVSSTDFESVARSLWKSNLCVFGWSLELASLVSGLGEPTYINRDNYRAILAK